jgi:DnaJ-class molecular chaperone
MTEEDHKAEETAKTLMGLKKCSLCRGRGRRELSDDYDSFTEVCGYCKGTGWVVPHRVKIS